MRGLSRESKGGDFMKLKLTKKEYKKWASNLLKFTAPALAVFFGQLALKVDWRVAGMVALLALYGMLADYFKKLK